MKCLKILHKGDEYVRIFMEDEHQFLAFRLKGDQVPHWKDKELFEGYEEITETELWSAMGWKIKDAAITDIAKIRYNAVSEFLPYLDDVADRKTLLDSIAVTHNMSVPTLKRHIATYLSTLSIASLCYRFNTYRNMETPAAQNMKWALKKFYYTQHRNSLKTVYEMMLQEKYTNPDGTLIEPHPTYEMLRHFYHKTKDPQQEQITRKGLKDYQRNSRPLLGAGVSVKYPNLGVAMVDTTVADVYVKQENGLTAARPYILAAVDACSGLCLGVVVSWTSTGNDVCDLLDAIIEDKKELCARHGILIDTDAWPNHNMLPSLLITDKGNEYCGKRIEGLLRAGVTLHTLPAYRPDLKGRVERFYHTIQSIYHPYLIGKGAVVDTPPQHGQPNYEKEACLTLDQFRTIVLRAIVFFNRDNTMNAFPYTQSMIDAGIEPTPAGIWKWKMQHGEHVMIEVPDLWHIYKLPTTSGTFTRRGLIVNSLRYRFNRSNESDPTYTNRYLSDSESVEVAYDPTNVERVWLVNENCVPFDLIEEEYKGMSLKEATALRLARVSFSSSASKHELSAKLELNRSIDTIVKGKVITDE